MTFGIPIPIQNNATFDFKRDSDCWYATTGHREITCAWQIVTNGQYGAQHRGEVYCLKWITSRGHLSQLEYDLMSDYNDNDTTEVDSMVYEYSDISTGEIDFGNDGVTINEVNGTIKVLSPKVLSEFDLTVWLPEDDIDNHIPDSIITPDKIIKSYNLTFDYEGIQNNDFEGLGEFETSYSGDTLILNFDIESIFVEFPQDLEVDYDDENFDVEVKFESHGQANNEQFGKKEISSTENMIENGVIDFKLYPNPVNNQLNLKYYHPQSSHQALKIKIYDSNGKLIFDKTVNGSNDAGVYEIFNISDFSSGVYFIRIEEKGRKSYLRKFIKK